MHWDGDVLHFHRGHVESGFVATSTEDRGFWDVMAGESESVTHVFWGCGSGHDCDGATDVCRDIDTDVNSGNFAKSWGFQGWDDTGMAIKDSGAV